MTEYNDLHKHKDCLRCSSVSIGDGKIERTTVQAKQFLKANNKAELKRVLSAFDTEAMANVLDFLVFDDAMLQKGRTYRDFKTDLLEFILELKRLDKARK